MTRPKEGAGQRTARVNSVRAEICRVLQQDPRLILCPRTVADGFGVNIKTVHNAAAELRKEGVLVTVTGYQLADSVRMPKLNRRQPPQSRLARPKPEPTYSEPASRIKGPRVASVFELGEALQRGARVEA